MNSTVLIIALIFIVSASAGSVKKSQDENHSDGRNVTFLNDEMTEVMKLCNESFPTSLDYLKTLNETGRFPPEAKQESKCYVYCVLEQLEIINEKGEVQNNSADELFPKDSNQKEVRDAVVKCIDSQKKDEKDVCEKAYQFVSCLMMEEISRHKKN